MKAAQRRRARSRLEVVASKAIAFPDKARQEIWRGLSISRLFARRNSRVRVPPRSKPAGRRTRNQRRPTMRFMVMVKATKDSEAGVLPDEKLLTAMGKDNEELAKAGGPLAGEGLPPSSQGAPVRF